jgi:hypothetical protein
MPRRDALSGASLLSGDGSGCRVPWRRVFGAAGDSRTKSEISCSQGMFVCFDLDASTLSLRRVKAQALRGNQTFPVCRGYIFTTDDRCNRRALHQGTGTKPDAHRSSFLLPAAIRAAGTTVARVSRTERQKVIAAPERSTFGRTANRIDRMASGVWFNRSASAARLTTRLQGGSAPVDPRRKWVQI